MKIHFMRNPFWNWRNAIYWMRAYDYNRDCKRWVIWIFSLQISIYPKSNLAKRR